MSNLWLKFFALRMLLLFMFLLYIMLIKLTKLFCLFFNLFCSLIEIFCLFQSVVIFHWYFILFIVYCFSLQFFLRTRVINIFDNLIIFKSIRWNLNKLILFLRKILFSFIDWFHYRLILIIFPKIIAILATCNNWRYYFTSVTVSSLSFHLPIIM